MGLVALAAADAAGYLAWGWGSREDEDRRAEIFAAVVTAVALVVAVALPLREAAAALVGILWGRCVWDVLHAPGVRVVGTDIAPRYPWVALAAKAAASALYLLFAFPA